MVCDSTLTTGAFMECFCLGPSEGALKINHFVHVCASVCVSVCRYVCMQICACAAMCMCVWAGACKFVCTGGCIHVHIHAGGQRLTLSPLGTLSFELGSLNWTCCS